MKASDALEDRFRPGVRPAPRPRSTATRGRVLAWVLVRVTGLLLTVLVLGHFAITHILTDVADTNAAFVGRRWGSALWLVWDWLMLAAALSHGGIGIWIAIEDYAGNLTLRRLLHRLLVAVTAVLFVLGTATIVRVVLG